MEDWDVKGISFLRKEGRFASFLLDLPKEIAWTTRKELCGMVLRNKGDEWILVVKATQKGKSFVHFIHGEDWVDCFRKLWVVNNRDLWSWKPDRYSTP